MAELGAKEVEDYSEQIRQNDEGEVVLNIDSTYILKSVYLFSFCGFNIESD